MSSAGAAAKKVYRISNIDCAACAMKMESNIQAIPEVKQAELNFPMQRLEVETTGADPDSLMDKYQAACDAVDEGVVIGAWDHGKVSEEKTEGKKESETGSQTTAQTVRKSILSEHKEEIRTIMAGILVYAAGIVLGIFDLTLVSRIVYVAAYVVLGAEIWMNAFGNIRKGQIFDENFLMVVATIGAFVVQEFPEAVGVMLFYRVGELFEDVAVDRSRDQIMDAVDMRPEVVTVLHGEEYETIPAEKAKAGDIIRIIPGDRVPLDGTILEGESRLDTSPVTGEPVPVAVKEGDSILSGCVNTSGLLKVRVDKPLSESMVTRILDSVENAAAQKPQMERFITRFSKYYTPVVVFAALFLAIVPSIATRDWAYWIKTAATFLVISCPCALVLSVPLSFFSGIGAASKKGILFKGGLALEAINGVKTLVMDKTGTITEGNFVVQNVVPVKNESLTTEDSEKLLLAACAGAESTSSHPIAESIVAAAKKKNVKIETPEEVEEIAGKGVRAKLPQGVVLCGNRKLFEQFGIALPDGVGEAYGTEVFVSLSGIYIGYIVIADTIKPDARKAVSQVKKFGIKTAVLTGDAEDNARKVAEEVGVDEVHARLLPENKVKELQEIRKEHGAVMFVGDGINDAPVLAGADVGCAMGSGADAAIEAADVVFMTSQMEAIPESIRLAKETMGIARQNVIFALTVKILALVLGVIGFANMWMAVFADTGVTVICVINSIRILYSKKFK